MLPDHTDRATVHTVNQASEEGLGYDVKSWNSKKGVKRTMKSQMQCNLITHWVQGVDTESRF